MPVPSARGAAVRARLRGFAGGDAGDPPFDRLDAMMRVAPLAEVPALGAAILKEAVQGRVVIDVNA